MADKNLRLTRRKVLGALGAAGAGAALGGAGTMAFFSDEEEFEGNRLVAGSLDLRVDWEEHYSDWSEDEAEGLQNEVLMNAPDDSGNWVGLPDPENPLIWVHNDDLDQFMTNTSIEAFPDSNDNGVQDTLNQFDACQHFAQLDDDLDPVNGGYTVDPQQDPPLTAKRTNNSDTNLADSEGETDVAPLVNLTDVKPGDFGELTLSFHLCDNPGYVWLTGGLVEAAENGVTEPEGQDPDEEGPEDEVTDDVDEAEVELLDEVQTLLWYDEDGDNVLRTGTEGNQVDIVLVLDRSGSIGGDLDELQTAANDLVDALTLDASDGAQVGLVSFSEDVTLDQGLTDDETDIENAINGLSSGGNTNLEGAVDAAHEELTGSDVSGDVTASGGARPDADKIMVVLTDGQPNVNGDGTDEADPTWGPDDPKDNADAAKSAGIEMFTIGFDVGGDTEALLEDMASDPTDDHAFIGGPGELTQIFGQISQILAGEEAFFRGSLRELLRALESTGPNNVAGIPLDGSRATEYDEVDGDNLPRDGTEDTRDCFVASTNNFVGFAWWLPADHGNEIQSDSVTFDLGFYTEQCRHNDGLGIAPEPNGNETDGNDTGNVSP